jgi:hypothetical protein
MTAPLVSLEAKLLSLQATRDFVNAQIAEIHKEMKQLQPAPRNMRNVLFPIVRDYNCTIGPHVKQFDDDCAIFGMNSQAYTKITHFEETTIYDILVVAGCFESKGQARKNWQGIKEIPTGYSEFGPVGKSKVHFFIWNPSTKE